MQQRNCEQWGKTAEVLEVSRGRMPTRTIRQSEDGNWTERLIKLETVQLPLSNSDFILLARETSVPLLCDSENRGGVFYKTPCSRIKHRIKH